ncbi:hypothetical protein KDD30_21330 (plasmid) [Photobacterium sp. GJ3]|uniref:hypothetical protein n=1 Tax=Photobacterium sp. GJ3 TaxID=2829502 RepID=UPI001B8C3E45|nr:hypothetical protein [Photobacterium sp. GJ3]QUJ69316.1 hypothetical protein KDD30_21330 [Photobacterium sp. GJ3]
MTKKNQQKKPEYKKNRLHSSLLTTGKSVNFLSKIQQSSAKLEQSRPGKTAFLYYRTGFAGQQNFDYDSFINVSAISNAELGIGSHEKAISIKTIVGFNPFKSSGV